MDAFPPLMIIPEGYNMPPVHLHFLCRLVGDAFVIHITLQVVLCFMAEVMLKVDDLKGRSVLELNGNSWKHITYHSAG